MKKKKEKIIALRSCSTVPRPNNATAPTSSNSEDSTAIDMRPKTRVQIIHMLKSEVAVLCEAYFDRDLSFPKNESCHNIQQRNKVQHIQSSWRGASPSTAGARVSICKNHEHRSYVCVCRAWDLS